MAANDAVMAALEANWEMVDSALDGLDEGTLAQLPNEQCNSIAWTLWHMNRIMDIFIHTRLNGSTQVWTRDGWNQKFGMGDDPHLRGVGWTAQQVGQWNAPSRDVQLGYYEAVKEDARVVLSSLSSSQLDNRNVIGVQLGGGKVMPPYRERRSVAEALGRMIWDNIAHGGQIAYLRGYFIGMGWHS
ncbi:MAG TPA: DinB family protein [Dehalococcoidia bacterium]|nr:DinB family protein [Dehalococcoidia bacterium]